MKIKHTRSTTEVANARRRAYPPLEELADALYHSNKGDNAPLLAYLAKCEAVKLANPKPAGSASSIKAKLGK